MLQLVFIILMYCGGVCSRTLYVFPTFTPAVNTSLTLLATMDPDTARLIGTVGETGVQRVHAVTYSGATLYVMATADERRALDCLHEVDVRTGVATLIGCDHHDYAALRVTGLAADSTGRLYAVARDMPTAGGAALVSVNASTGDIAMLGRVGDACTGYTIEFGPGDRLYAQGCGRFGTIDVESGAFSELGGPVAQCTTDMSYNPATGIMYALAEQNDSGGFFTVDVRSGALSQIGAAFAHDAIPALAFETNGLNVDVQVSRSDAGAEVPSSWFSSLLDTSGTNNNATHLSFNIDVTSNADVDDAVILVKVLASPGDVTVSSMRLQTGAAEIINTRTVWSKDGEQKIILIEWTLDLNKGVVERSVLTVSTRNRSGGVTVSGTYHGDDTYSHHELHVPLDSVVDGMAVVPSSSSSSSSPPGATAFVVIVMSFFVIFVFFGFIVHHLALRGET